jgi:hypothetical protein
MVTREQWLAEKPKSDPKHFQMLPELVIISHTATEMCFNKVIFIWVQLNFCIDDLKHDFQSYCSLLVRDIQQFHIHKNNWSDIGYNFLVGGDGNIYEGRGWTFIGSHTKNHNAESIGISLIGKFDMASPTDVQFLSTKKLMEYGWKKNKMSIDYKLYGQRQLSGTDSPGDVAFAEIQKWPHFSKNSSMES